jgi:hypothetical protein
VSFLFPLYLLGALAVLIPIALHLRRRPARDRIEFSSTLFLDPQKPPNRRSRRIENWVLLALRCAALACLALLFARPLWRAQTHSTPSQGAVRLFLLDRSASMRQSGAWEEAIAALRKQAASAAPGDRIALCAFDQGLEILVPFTTAPEVTPAIEGALRSLTPGWAGTALDSALLSAASLVQEESRLVGNEREIVLISDFPESADRDRLQTSAWPTGIRLIGVQVPARDAPPPVNAFLQVVASAQEEEEEEEGESAPGVRTAETVRLRLSRSGGGPEDAHIAVRWKDQPTSALTVRLPPGASRVFHAPPRPTPESMELELTGDAENFDNRAFVAPRRARPVRILYAGPQTDPGDAKSPFFFLSRSLSPTQSLRPDVRALPIGELTAASWQDLDVVILTGALDVSQSPSLRNFVGSGGLAVVLLADAASGAWLAALDPGFAVSEAPVKDYALFESIDFDHAIFSPFAAPGLRDFSKIHTWKHRLLNVPAPARILARFDSQAPALVEWKIGKGRILLSAFNWVPSDSQLPLSSKFVPLIYSILGEAGFEHLEPDRYLVGDSWPGPSGASFQATAPGIYPIQQGKEERLVACNLPPSESRLETFPVESLAAFGIPVGRTGRKDAEPEADPAPLRLQSAEWEGKQRLWKWLLPALLSLLLVETWWANRFRPRAAESFAG